MSILFTSLYHKIVHFFTYNFMGYDYVAEAKISSKKITECLCKCLDNQYNYITKLSTSDNYISENESNSYFDNLVKGFPPIINWKVSDFGIGYSKIKINFQLPSQLKNKLWLCVCVIGCLNFWFFLSKTEDSGIDSAVSFLKIFFCYFPSFIGLGFMYLIGFLLEKYHNFGEKILQETSKQYFDNLIIKTQRFENHPHRIFIDTKLFVAFILVTIIPALQVYNTIPFIYQFLGITIATCLVMMIIIGLKGLQDSLCHIKIVSISSNIFLSITVIFILILLPIVLYFQMQNVLALDDKIFEKYGATIAVMLHNQDKYAGIINFTKIWHWSMGMILSVFGVQFIAYTLGFFILFMTGKSIRTHLLGSNSKHNKNIKNSFKSNKNAKSYKNLMLPKTLRSIVWGLYVTISVLMWAGVYINLIIIISLLWPDCFLASIEPGKTISKGAAKLTSIFLMGNSSKYVNYLAAMLISPLMWYFLKFSCINLYYAIKSPLKYYFMRRVKPEATAQVNSIAEHFNIGTVTCLIDKRSSSFSPCARISGFKSRKLLIFSKNSLDFISEHPQYAEAIIAHEIGHLNNDCHIFRKYAILSRLGLLGAGFLSVLHDSITMEDEADENARKYLRDYNKDERLVKEAAYTIERHEALFNNSQNNHELRFAKYSESKRNNKDVLSSPFKMSPFKAARKFYFDTEVYDYLHREAKDR